MDTTEHINVTDVAKANVGLRTRRGCFAKSTVMKLIGRPHFNVFYQNRLIPPNFDVHLKLVPIANNYLCKSVASNKVKAGQQNYKAVIQFASFIVYTKQLTSEAEIAHKVLLRQKVMSLPYTRVQVKHLSIPQNQTNNNFDNVITGRCQTW